MESTTCETQQEEVPAKSTDNDTSTQETAEAAVPPTPDSTSQMGKLEQYTWGNLIESFEMCYTIRFIQMKLIFSLYSDTEDSEAPAVEPDQSQPESKTNEEVTADQPEQAFSGAVLITSFETVAFRKKSLTSADG